MAFCSEISNGAKSEYSKDVAGVILFWLFDVPVEDPMKYAVTSSVPKTCAKKRRLIASEQYGKNSDEHTAFFSDAQTSHIRFCRTFSLLNNRTFPEITVRLLCISAPTTRFGFFPKSNAETRFVKDIFCLSECYESREK